MKTGRPRRAFQVEGALHGEGLRAREEPILRGLKEISCRWKEQGVMTDETCEQARGPHRASQGEDFKNDPEAARTAG